MKWKNIKTRAICFDMDLWKEIVKLAGKTEDETKKETTISDVVNDLCKLGLSKSNQRK
jgi:hypothetical protein